MSTTSSSSWSSDKTPEFITFSSSEDEDNCIYLKEGPNHKKAKTNLESNETENISDSEMETETSNEQENETGNEKEKKTDKKGKKTKNLKGKKKLSGTEKNKQKGESSILSDSSGSTDNEVIHIFCTEARELESHRPTKFDKLLGKPAPDWRIKALTANGTVRTVSSTDYIGKHMILIFYPLDFGQLPEMEAPIEIFYINEKYEKFRGLNIEFVGCCVDSYHTHRACLKYYSRVTSMLCDLKFPLLADVHHKIASAYGLYSERLAHSFRAAVIINTKGVIVDGIRVPRANLLPIDQIVAKIIKERLRRL